MNHPHLRTRRDFLRTGALGAAASFTVPNFLSNTFAQLHNQADGSLTQSPTGADNTILVIIQLAGGNDGLNTVIPHADDNYYRLRPQLNIARDQLRRLNDQFGLHPNLPNLQAAIGNGSASLIHGVGYPNPNRSHFRATEIWHWADAQQASSSGWIGRYFDNACQGADPTVGIAVTGSTPAAFQSNINSGISLSEPKDFRWQSEDNASQAAQDIFSQVNQPNPQTSSQTNDTDHNLDFIERTALDTQVAIEKVRRIRSAPRRHGYANRGIGSQLELISRMIHGNFSTRVYYASHGGFDTHNNQLGNHANRLQEYDQALAAFQNDLRESGNNDRVVVLTFSEFGRRVQQNASAGTDHGAAAPVFLHGDALRGGMHGQHPSLTELHRGDLVHSTDFRSIYATLLQDWLHTDPQPILGASYPTLPLFRAQAHS